MSESARTLVWVCPDCGQTERYDGDIFATAAAYVPFCEWCADDPEGRAELAMVLHVALDPERVAEAATRLEAIIEWHEADPDDGNRCACNLGYPCPSLNDAVAALVLLVGTTEPAGEADKPHD